MAIGGGDYELTATFRARVDGSVGRSFNSMEARLTKLEKKIQEVSGDDVKVDFKEEGLDKLNKRIDALEKKLTKVGKMKAEPEVGLDDAKMSRTEKRLNDYQRKLEFLSKRPWKSELAVDDRTAKRRITQVQGMLENISKGAYNARLRAEIDGDREVAARFRELQLQADRLSMEKIEMKVELDGATAVSAQLAFLRTALDAATTNTGEFARGMYILQQAMFAATAALVALAVAASGPLLAGLTILVATVGTLAGGFGLVAAATIPFISALSNAKQNATQLESAQDSLASSSQSLKSAQDGLDSAIQGVADAHRQGAEQIQQAQSAYRDAQEATADATDELTTATEDLERAQASEQYRLRSMTLDLEGMRLSQKELALELQQAEKDLAQASNPQERKEAELRIAQLKLQQKQNTLDMTQAEKELADARKNGTTELQSAQDAQKQAQKAAEDARQAETEAYKAIGKARQDAARQEQDALKAVASAQEQVAQAMKAQADAQSKVNELTAKMKNNFGPALAAVERLKAAYGRFFAAAQRGMNNIIVRGINTAIKLMPMLGTTANRTVQGINRAFSRIGQDFKNFGVLNSIQRIFNSMPSVTQRWTTAIGRFSGAFLNIMGQAMPYVRQFSRWVNHIALQLLKWTRSEKGRKQLKQFFESAAPVAKALWKWILKIAGAILKWSIKHPQRLAAMIKNLGKFAMAAGKVIGWVATRVIKLGASEHGLLKLIAGFILLRAVVGLALRGVLWLIARGMTKLAQYALRVIPAAFRAMGKGILAVLRGVGQLFMRFFGLEIRAAAMFVGRFLAIFARLSVIGAIVYTIVRFFINGYNEIFNVTIPTIKGLNQMWKSGSITSSQYFFNIWRQMMSSWARMVLGTVIDVASAINKVLSPTKWFDSKSRGLFDPLISEARDGLNKLTGAIRGETNKQAQTLGKNFDKMNKSGTQSTQDLQQTTAKDITLMRHKIETETNKANQTGSKNFKNFNLSGGKSMKELFGKTDTSLKDILGSTNTNTGNMKTKGLANFKGFQTGGTRESDLLRGNAIKRIGAMQLGVNKSTTTTKEKGIAAITDMQQQGTAQMSIVQEQWVDKAWDTSLQTQQSFNAILAGMAKFIENSGVTGVSKPEQFQLQGRQGGDIRGSANNRGLVNGHVDRRYAGGVDKFASGGEMAPVGGVAQGTTRIMGEIPGTTEFYITDNPQYRKRNMGILQQANNHMLRNFSGDVKKFATGGALPPKQPWNHISGGGIGYSASGQASSLMSAGARMWQGLVRSGGPIDVKIVDLPGNVKGMSYSNGGIDLDPASTGVAAAHEAGHHLGLGHGGDSIMGGAGRVTENDFAALNQYYGIKTPSGAGRSTNSPGGTSDRNPDKGTANTSHTSAGPGRANTSSISVVSQQSGSGGTTSSKGNLRDVGNILGGRRSPGSGAEGSKRERDHRRKHDRNRRHGGRHGGGGGLLGGLGGMLGGILGRGRGRRRRGYISGLGEGLGPEIPDSQLNSKVRQYAQAISQATGTSFNSYVGHGLPGGSTQDYTVDFWGPGGRGAQIDRSAGFETADLALNKYNHDPNVLYVIRQGEMWRGSWGGWRPWPSDPHYDHTHVSWVSPHGADPGANMGKSSRDYGKEFDQQVPKMDRNLNYGKVGEAARKRGDYIRGKAKEQLVKKAGGTSFSGSSGKGLTIGDAVRQGGWADNLQSTAAGVAYEESGGNAGARNPSGAYGLFQIMPTTARAMGADYNKLGDPVYNSQVGYSVYKAQGWGAWVAYPPSKEAMGMADQKIVGYAKGGVYPAGAYAHGGLTTTSQLGLLHKNELNVPLDNPRSVRALANAFQKSRMHGHTDGDSDRNMASDKADSSGKGIPAGGDEKTHELLSGVIGTLQEPMRLHEDDISGIASLVLRAIYAGMESPKGAEKMDKSLGRKWLKEAKTKGDI